MDDRYANFGILMVDSKGNLVFTHQGAKSKSNYHVIGLTDKRTFLLKQTSKR